MNIKRGDTVIFIVKDKINNIESYESLLSTYLEENYYGTNILD